MFVCVRKPDFIFRMHDKIQQWKKKAFSLIYMYHVYIVCCTRTRTTALVYLWMLGKLYARYVLYIWYRLMCIVYSIQYIHTYYMLLYDFSGANIGFADSISTGPQINLWQVYAYCKCQRPFKYASSDLVAKWNFIRTQCYSN